MNLDWSLILTWIVQGLILAGFAIVGVYAGLRLFGQRPAAPTGDAAAASASTATAPANGAHAASPLAHGSLAQPSQLAGLAVSAALPAAPAPRHAGPHHDPDHPDIRHAFEFDEGDRVAVILEMPLAYLDDSASLVETWVQAVGWAKVERLHKQNEARRSLAALDKSGHGVATAAIDPDRPEMLQEQLGQVLHRLQISAERRRELRQLLAGSLDSAYTSDV